MIYNIIFIPHFILEDSEKEALYVKFRYIESIHEFENRTFLGNDSENEKKFQMWNSNVK